MSRVFCVVELTSEFVRGTSWFRVVETFRAVEALLGFVREMLWFCVVGVTSEFVRDLLLFLLVGMA